MRGSEIPQDCKGFPGGTSGKEPPANAGDVKDAGWIPGLEDPLAEEVAIHSSILLGESPWTEALYSP